MKLRIVLLSCIFFGYTTTTQPLVIRVHHMTKATSAVLGGLAFGSSTALILESIIKKYNPTYNLPGLLPVTLGAAGLCAGYRIAEYCTIRTEDRSSIVCACYCLGDDDDEQNMIFDEEEV